MGQGLEKGSLREIPPAKCGPIHTPNVWPHKIGKRIVTFLIYFNEATIDTIEQRTPLYVKELLGHHSIKNTLIYTHLVNFEPDEYTVKAATSLEECAKLLETGFEHVTTLKEKSCLGRGNNTATAPLPRKNKGQVTHPLD